MFKKILISLGALALIAGITLGGYFVVTNTSLVVAQASTNSSCTNGTLTVLEVHNALKAGTIIISFENYGSRVAGTVENNTDCAFPAGQMSYSVYDQHLDNQVFYNASAVVTVPAHSTKTLSTSVPSCMAQTDMYYGQGPTQLHDALANTPWDTNSTLKGVIYGSTGTTWSNAAGNFCEHTPEPSTLKLVKTVVNTNGGTKQVSDFALFIGSTQVTSGQTKTLTAGTYSVHENNLTGYEAESWGGDCSADGSVTLHPGDHKVCTITNHDIPVVVPSLNATCASNTTSTHIGENVVYTATVTGGTGSYTYAWSGTDNLSGTESSVTKSYSTSGTKTAHLVVTSGSKTDTADCHVKIIENPPQTGCIAIRKETYDTNGNVLTPVAQFSFTLDGNRSTTNDAEGSAKFYDVTPGIHTVTENAANGWTNFVVTPDNGSVNVPAGSQCAAVIFKNKQNQPPNNPPAMTASCYASASQVNVGSSVNYYSNVSGGNGNYTYSWSGTDGLISNSSSASQTYNNPGYKSATVYVSSNGQTISATCNTNVIQQYVYNSLTGSCWVSTGTANVGYSVTWNANASGGNGNYTYSWNGWDNLYGNGNSVSKQYYTTGQKAGTVTISDGNQSITKTCYTSIVQPTSNLIASCQANPSSAYVGERINWSANATGGNGSYTYSWNGTNGISNNYQSFAQVYTTPGQKSATVTVWSNGQRTSQTCNVYVQARPTIVPPPSTTGGVYLSQVPYTGIGSNMKVALFVLALLAWSALVSYYMIARKARKQGLSVGQLISTSTFAPVGPSTDEVDPRLIPILNLPTDNKYEALFGSVDATPKATGDFTTDLESFARSSRMLISQDAMRMISATTGRDMNHAEQLVQQLSSMYRNELTDASDWVTLNAEKVSKIISHARA